MPLITTSRSVGQVPLLRHRAPPRQAASAPGSHGTAQRPSSEHTRPVSQSLSSEQSRASPSEQTPLGRHASEPQALVPVGSPHAPMHKSSGPHRSESAQSALL